MPTSDPQTIQQIVQFLARYGTPAGIAAAQTVGTTAAQALTSGTTKAIKSLWDKIRHRSKQEGSIAEEAVTAFEIAPHEQEYQQALSFVLKQLCGKDAAFANEITEAFNEIQRDPIANQFIQNISGHAQVGIAGVNYGPVTIHQTTQMSRSSEEEFAKIRDEIERRNRADILLLKADQFATSLLEKSKLVIEAVELWPPYKQERYRLLGLEMSAAVIGNVDAIKQWKLAAAGYPFDQPYSESKLDEEERTFFTEHAIRYLTEMVLNSANPDAEGLLYLACMYGYLHQYDEMVEVLGKASQISLIVQVMKDEYRERPMMLILLGACGTDQAKIDRLRETLHLPRTTEQFFRHYITEVYPLNPNYLPGEFIKWTAVRRPEAFEVGGTAIISISPLYPSLQGTVYAFTTYPDGRPQEIVPPQQDKRVSIEELYRKLTYLFILFCPVD